MNLLIHVNKSQKKSLSFIPYIGARKPINWFIVLKDKYAMIFDFMLAIHFSCITCSPQSTFFLSNKTLSRMLILSLTWATSQACPDSSDTDR